MKSLSSYFLAICIIITTTHLCAQIPGAYVDATPSNTVPLSAIDANPTPTNSDTDNKWWYRPNGSWEGGAVMEGMGSVYEDCPIISTTVSGLPNKSYNVYLIYWAYDDPNQNWTTKAGFTQSNLILCTKSSGAPTGKVYGAGPIKQYAVHLGVVSGTSITVYVDDALYPNDRAWYDGFSYVPVGDPPVYVDANPSNTQGVWKNALADSMDDTDDLWTYRNLSYCAEGSIFESAGGKYEDCPTLVTAIAVPNGIYKVSVLYWTSEPANGWRIRAAMNAEDVQDGRWTFTTHGLTTGVSAPAGVPFQRKMAIPSGVVSVRDGQLKVFIDDEYHAYDSTVQRTWYDGIAYERIGDLNDGIIKGTLEWENWQSARSEDIVLTVDVQMGSTSISGYPRPVPTIALEGATIQYELPDIPNGVCNLIFSTNDMNSGTAHWLKRRVPDVLVNGNTVQVDKKIMLNGDITHDNKVDDFDILVWKMPGFVSDINGDGAVSIADVNAISVNLGKVGE